MDQVIKRCGGWSISSVEHFQKLRVEKKSRNSQERPIEFKNTISELSMVDKIVPGNVG